MYKLGHTYTFKPLFPKRRIQVKKVSLHRECISQIEEVEFQGQSILKTVDFSFPIKNSAATWIFFLQIYDFTLDNQQFLFPFLNHSFSHFLIFHGN